MQLFEESRDEFGEFFDFVMDYSDFVKLSCRFVMTSIGSKIYVFTSAKLHKHGQEKKNN